MLKLKLQYFGRVMLIADSLEKTLMLGKIEGKRRRGQQRMSWLDSITDSMDMNLSKFQETAKARVAWHAATHRVTKSQTWLSDWTTTFPILDLERTLFLCPLWHASSPRTLLDQWSVSRSSTCFSQVKVLSQHSIHYVYCTPFSCRGVLWAHVEVSFVSLEWLWWEASPIPPIKLQCTCKNKPVGLTEIWGLFVITAGWGPS